MKEQWAEHQILGTRGLASIGRRPLITPILQSPLDGWEESIERKRVDPHRVDEVDMGGRAKMESKLPSGLT